MARASFYDFIPDRGCLFCFGATDETLPFEHWVSDLSQSTVQVPCHRRCYRRRVRAVWLRLVLVGVGWALVLTSMEAVVLNLAVGWEWGRVPLGGLVANGVAGFLAGAWSALRRYGTLRSEINHYVQLRTIPYD